MIDIILAIIVGVIALIAALLIPSKAKIQRNETAKYKSGKYFIYAAGFGALVIGIFIIALYVTSEENQTLPNMLKMVFFVAVGLALISENLRKSKFLTAHESAMPSITAEAVGVEVMAQTVPGTQPYAQAQAQQIGIKATPAVQTQPQVQAQQIGIKTMPKTQAQPQAQATQIGIKAQPIARLQPQMVAPQPRPPAPPATKPRIVVIKCPKCAGSMQINTAMLGQKMKCPHCGVEGRIG